MKQRNSAFELMRIVAMYMVVLGHSLMAIALDSKVFSPLDHAKWLIGAFTVPAVNLFFLLTGYYATSDCGNNKKVIYTWIKVQFYSVGIYLLFSGVEGSFELKEMIKYAFPVTFGTYWYMQTYIVLSLVLPYLMTGLMRIEKRWYDRLIIILLAFFSLHQTFIPVDHTLDRTQGYGIIWAIVMCVLGKWLNLYGKETILKIHAAWYLLVYVLFSLAIYVSNVVIVHYDIASGVDSRGNFYAYNSITVLLQSVFLFCFFICLSSLDKRNRTVNLISKNTVAVYLISSHPVLLYSLWTEMIQVNNIATNTIGRVLACVFISVLILLVCVVIDRLLERALGYLLKTRWIKNA